MEKLIMEVQVQLTRRDVSRMKSAYGSVVFFPFTGNVDSNLFKGNVLPGAVDVQTVDPAGIRHMCAKYLLEGTDFKGNPCHVYIENNGYFEPKSGSIPFHAYPQIMSDSEVLGEYFARASFRAEGYPDGDSVCIKIFDTNYNGII